MLVDSGYFLADDRNAHGDLRPDTVVKDDWAAKAYDQFPVDVVNLSSRELKYFSRFLTKAEFEPRAASQPLLRRLVSANTLSGSPDMVTPQPFIILEVPGRQKNSAATSLRIAFIGLTDTEGAPPRGFKFIDPLEAVNRALPEARKRADLVIVLAYLKPDEVSRVAHEAEGIDAIIATNRDGLPFTPPITSGKTSIVFTALETRLLGELRFYRDSLGKYSSACRFISLDEIIPDDPVAKQVVTAASSAEIGARSTSKQFLEEWLTSSRMLIRSHAASRGLSGSAGGRYITSAACSQCHGAQYLKWASSAHSHATDPLPPRPFEFEANCLNCHATGWAGTRAEGSTRPGGLQAVQCEQCHGPGAEHAAKPVKGYGRIPDMKTACSTCHTPTTSPGFDLQAAWAKIKH